jgi:hypothetical protein
MAALDAEARLLTAVHASSSLRHNVFFHLQQSGVGGGKLFADQLRARLKELCAAHCLEKQAHLVTLQGEAQLRQYIAEWDLYAQQVGCLSPPFHLRACRRLST